VHVDIGEVLFGSWRVGWLVSCSWVLVLQVCSAVDDESRQDQQGDQLVFIQEQAPTVDVQ
jgi:hypothetical protein